MAWIDGVDRATGFLVSAVNWNELLGANGSLMDLKLHQHTGAAGSGDDRLEALEFADFVDAVAPAAPGAGQIRVYSTSGQPRFRAGAAGADTLFVDDAMTQFFGKWGL